MNIVKLNDVKQKYIFLPLIQTVYLNEMALGELKIFLSFYSTKKLVDKKSFKTFIS